MTRIDLILMAVALAMDAFAVSMCQGLTMKRATFKKALIVGLYFGIFQAAMPTVGYFAAWMFADQIRAFAPWIAFVLLAFLGVRMIVGSRKKDDECDTEEKPLTFKLMLPLAIATSIDAMAAGIPLAPLGVNIAEAAAYIGIITMAISMAGVKIGCAFGAKFKSGAELTGGIVLTLIGLKILLEHLGLLIL